MELSEITLLVLAKAEEGGSQKIVTNSLAIVKTVNTYSNQDN